MSTQPHSAFAPPPPASAAPARARHPDPLPHDRYRWTPAKAVAFLRDLADHGNVARAARSVGMTRQSAYRLRDRSPVIAEAWPLAIEAGARRAALALSKAEVRRMAAWQREQDAAWFAGELPARPDSTPQQDDAAFHSGDTRPAAR